MKANISMRRNYISIILLAVFFFVFLGTEYLFDNCMMHVTDMDGVVRAQNYVLGVSAVGFFLYRSAADFFAARRIWLSAILSLLLFGIDIICVIGVLHHAGYMLTIYAGCILFLNLGILGAWVHYRMARALSDRAVLARCVGFAYAGGIILQFLSNNLIHKTWIEACLLMAGCGVITLSLIAKGEPTCTDTDSREEETPYPISVCVMFAVIIFFVTIIFATLDNTVTSAHAAGTVDIGQWPRLLLAVSGIAAGFLFDMRGRKWMHMIMYCVTLLSTICVIMIGFGGSFLVGLLVFYLSAGFFSVYFTAGFMELSYHSAAPKLWAGFGRAVNNLCALVTLTFAGKVTSAGYGVMIAVVLLFAVISALLFAYQNQLCAVQIDGICMTEESPDQKDWAEAVDKFAAFSSEYALTDREQEVLQTLLSSDENVQDIAHTLGISRAAIYRHISNMNEKTETKARIGLIQFYYGWNPEK